MCTAVIEFIPPHAAHTVVEPRFWYIDFGLENAIRRLLRGKEFQAQRGNCRPAAATQDGGEDGGPGESYYRGMQ
jgi:hypothetical protein